MFLSLPFLDHHLGVSAALYHLHFAAVGSPQQLQIATGELMPIPFAFTAQFDCKQLYYVASS